MSSDRSLRATIQRASSGSERWRRNASCVGADIQASISSSVPEAGTLVELLCEDHVGTYLLPFLCRSTAEGFRNERTGEAVTAVVVGWRAPTAVSPGRRSASSRVD